MSASPFEQAIHRLTTEHYETVDRGVNSMASTMSFSTCVRLVGKHNTSLGETAETACDLNVRPSMPTTPEAWTTVGDLAQALAIEVTIKDLSPTQYFKSQGESGFSAYRSVGRKWLQQSETPKTLTFKLTNEACKKLFAHLFVSPTENVSYDEDKLIETIHGMVEKVPEHFLASVPTQGLDIMCAESSGASLRMGKTVLGTQTREA